MDWAKLERLHILSDHSGILVVPIKPGAQLDLFGCISERAQVSLNNVKIRTPAETEQQLSLFDLSPEPT